MRARGIAVVALWFAVGGCLASLDLEELQQGCPAGQKVCGERCVALDDPSFGCAAASCEPCDIANGVARCDGAGACTAESCESRFKACDGVCVSVLTPLYGCNRVGCDPCTLPDATAGCSAVGECIIAACAARRGDCDRTPTTGCETNLNEDVEHCSACNTPCPELPNAEVTCGGANCVVRTCDAGWGNCNTSQTDGCETNVRISNSHCGGCNKPCAAGLTCVDGTCQ